MRPPSTAQATASRLKQVPALEQVRDDVWSVGLAVPGGYISYSLAYLVRDADAGFHVVDPGWASAANHQLLGSALSGVGGEVAAVRSVFVTHLHSDHLGSAQWLQQSGAGVVMHDLKWDALSSTSDCTADSTVNDTGLADQLDRWWVPESRRDEFVVLRRPAPPAADDLQPRILVGDGEHLEMPGLALTTMLTPGHTRGHLCLRDDDRNIPLTGDHVLPTLHAGLGVGGPGPADALVDYLSSLERVSRYRDHEALPGHGYRFDGLAVRAEESAEHHLCRAHEVAAVVADDPDATTWVIGATITWSAGWDNLHAFYLYSALAQTAMHHEYILQQH